MSFCEKVQCLKCDKTESLMWHRREKGIICNDCNECDKANATVEEEESKQSATSEKSKTSTKKNSKSTPNYKTRQNPNALPKQVSLKGKGRRNSSKKNPPVKLQRSRADFVTVNWLLHEGTLFRIGDIVSVQDVEGGTYYAQIKGLMVDEYCGKSASITWLLPTRNDSSFVKEGFDPLTFIIGPDEDFPRNINCFEFVMHAPSDYFRSNCPFPTGVSQPRETGYIWRRLR